MRGCCGQKSNDQNNTNNNRDRCVLIDANASTNKCMPSANSSHSRGKYVSGQHDEEVCHGTGERRRDLLDQLKIFLGEFDERPCTVTPPQQGPDAIRELGSYSEYLKKHCQSWMPPSPRPPLITSVQTHEVRASSDYEKMKAENSEYVSFTDATPKPPVFTCDCVKRNGLQDQCPHPMCKPPTAQCRANNPGPCCPPSLGLGGPEAVLGGSKQEKTAGTAGGHQSAVQGGVQGSLQHNDFQKVFICYPSGGQPVQSKPPQQLPPQEQTFEYTTTYRQDYQGKSVNTQCGQQWQNQQHIAASAQQQQPPTPVMAFQHPGGPGVPKPPPGMEIVCICKAPSSALPSGKKYLCCPIPQ